MSAPPIATSFRPLPLVDCPTLTPPAAAHETFLAPLKIGSFRAAWLGLTCVTLADQAQAVLLALVALDLVGTAGGWAGVLAAQAAPRLLLTAIGGVAVDRLRPQRVLWVVGILATVALASLAVVAAVGLLALPHLYIYGVAYGVLAAFTMPAIESLVPSLLPLPLIRRGNALRSLAINIGRFVAPLAATLLFAHSGGAVALLLPAGCFLIASLVFCRLRYVDHPHSPPESLARQLRQGIVFASRQALVGVPILMLVIFNLGFSGAIFVGVPALAKLDLDVGAQGLGILLGALGAGSLLGSASMVVLPAPRRMGLFACAVVASIGLGLIGVSLAPWLWAAAAFMAVSGVGMACGAVALLTVVQTNTPAELRGRVMALWSLGLTSLTPVSYILSGLIGDSLGPRGLLMLGGTCVLSAAALGVSCAAMRRAGDKLDIHPASSRA